MKKDNVYIVIPAYNEEKNIRKVVNDYSKIINKIKNDSKLIIVDDGSKDQTYNVALKEAKKHKNVEILKKKNGGHGSALIYGYKYALKSKTKYIFQTDSDNQTNPEEFWEFWENRNENDVIIGSRKKRKDGLSRIIVTKVLKYLLFLIFGILVEDANTPFRLMKADVLQKYINKFDNNYNLPNVMLSVYFVFYKEKLKFIPITFEDRKEGINSINIKKITKIGINSIKDFYNFRNDMIDKNKSKNYYNILMLIFCLILSIIGITFISNSSPIYFTNVYPDSNAYFTVGKSILNGYVPYRDLFDQKGPILYFINMIAALISYKSFIGIYLIEIILFTLFLYFNYKIINLFLDKKYAYLILPLYAALILSSKCFGGGGYPEEIVLSIFSYSLYKILQSIIKDKDLTLKNIFFHGFLCGIIFMIKFTLVGFYFGFMIFIIIKKIFDKKYKELFLYSFIFLLGMIIPFIFCSIYFIFNNAFKDFIDTYFIFNLTAYPNSNTEGILTIINNQFKYINSLIPLLIHLAFIGVIYYFASKKILKKYNKLLPVLLFGFMFLFIFINGKSYYYYPLTLSVFSILGFISLIHYFENSYYKISNKIFIFLTLISVVTYIPMLLTSKNLNHLFLDDKSYPIEVFADTIKKDNKNSTVLNYGILDSGIHNLLGTTPQNKYFIKLNVDEDKYPKLMNSQNNILKNKKVDYIIYTAPTQLLYLKSIKTTINEVEKNYKLVKSMDQITEGILKRYYLYKKKD